MADMMEFPETFDEFVDSYGFIDTEEVYTNGSQLIPVFRVKQWFEHIKALSEDKTQMIDKSNFDAEQYKADLQSAYDCGYNKALSENKGDLISRQAVLDGIDKYIEKAQSTGTIDDFNSFAELVVKTLPSVENKGEWTHGVCNKCGYDWGKDAPIASVPNFCPNCGARMKGGE